jgi:hypothetical protein
MVIDSASRLISFLEEFDLSNKNHYKILSDLVEQYPNFHLIKPYFLKGVEQNHPERYDEILSHTAIATFDRQVLYEFLETQKGKPLLKTAIKVPKEKVTQDKPKKKKKKKSTSPEKKSPDKLPKELSFSDWATYLRDSNTDDRPDNIEDKFKLFDNFLEKKKKLKPQKDSINKDDLSLESLASTDELMTETLAKVFVKQKKYENALQAYQILSLKYPEKNSFFADQIKEIKRLQKLKE